MSEEIYLRFNNISSDDIDILQSLGDKGYPTVEYAKKGANPIICIHSISYYRKSRADILSDIFKVFSNAEEFDILDGGAKSKGAR